MNPLAQAPAASHSPSGSKLKFCTPKAYQILTIAIGAILVLAGIFLTLAAFQLYPQRANFISHLGTVKYAVAFCPLGIGSSNLIFGITMCFFNQTSPRQKVDFSQITPENFEHYFDLSSPYDPKKAHYGDFFFQSAAAGETLYGHLLDVDKVCISECLVVKEGCFFHKGVRSEETGKAFANFRDYLDYLFIGDYPDSKSISSLPLVRLRALDGSIITYQNRHQKPIRV